MKKNLLVLLTILLIYSGTGILQVQANVLSTSVDDLLEKMEKSINDDNWEDFIELWHEDEQPEFENYFKNDEYTDGIKQIEDIKILEKYHVQKGDAKEYMLTDEYPILKETSETETYIIAAECKVGVENQYFYNGLNYILIVFIKENDNLYMVQFNNPDLELMDKYITETYSKSDENYEEELKAYNVVKQAEYGRIVNIDNELIDNNFVEKEIDMSQSGDMFATLKGVGDYSILKSYSSYSYPSTIRVKLANGTIKTINFNTYIKNVLPNEWYSTWSANSLKAGALCVKMVGWYRCIKPISTAQGYDITTTTQKYVAGTAVSSTNSAISSVSNIGMANSDGKIFFPEYAAGTSGSAGTKAGGQLKQWGSQYLAQKGYTVGEILNYYYSGSCYSSGNLKFFSIS